MSTGYDYTANDVPFDDASEIDDFVIAGSAAPSKSAEQIQKENTYADIPPGDYLLVVHSIPERPRSSFYKVNVGGVMLSYEAASFRVKFCLPDNPRATIEDYFVLPPDNPDEMRAYWEGVPEGKKAVGFNANKFYQFIGAMGWPYPPGGKLPAEACRLGNWKGRTIHATVAAGSSYVDRKTGLEKPGRNQVKLFSYRTSEATAGGQGHRGGSPAGAGTHPADGAPRLAQVVAPAGGATHHAAPRQAPAMAGSGQGAARGAADLDL